MLLATVQLFFCSLRQTVAEPLFWLVFKGNQQENRNIAGFPEICSKPRSASGRHIFSGTPKKEVFRFVSFEPGTAKKQVNNKKIKHRKASNGLKLVSTGPTP